MEVKEAERVSSFRGDIGLWGQIITLRYRPLDDVDLRSTAISSGSFAVEHMGRRVPRHAAELGHLALKVGIKPETEYRRPISAE
jgi:hypothetical protein